MSPENSAATMDPGDRFDFSKLGRLDARAKLAGAFLLVLTLMVLPTGPGLWAAAGLTIATPLLLRARLMRLIAPLLLLSWMFVITVLVHGFATSGHLLWEVPGTGWILTREGIEKGLMISMRLVLAVIMAGTVALTTDILDIIQAIETAGTPLRKIGINLGVPAMILGLAIRFVPALYDETMFLKKALVARGWSRGKGFAGRIAAWLPIIIPLLVNGLRRSDDLAEALVIRGYDPGKRRTSMFPVVWGLKESTAIALSLVPILIWILFDIV